MTTDHETSSNGARDVLVHYHIFKNAGCSFDECLDDSFGDRFVQLNRTPPAAITHGELVMFLHEHSEVRALSSHTARWPEPSANDTRAHPVLFLRHPIDRVGSIYAYLRRVGDEAATSRTFGEYVDWLLGAGRDEPYSESGFAAAASFQTLYLSDERHITQTETAPLCDVTDAHISASRERLRLLPAFGLVERFDESLLQIECALLATFPELVLRPRRANESGGRASRLADRINDVAEALGRRRYARLVRMNEPDLELYNLAETLFDSRRAAMTSISRGARSATTPVRDGADRSPKGRRTQARRSAPK